MQILWLPLQPATSAAAPVTPCKPSGGGGRLTGLGLGQPVPPLGFGDGFLSWTCKDREGLSILPQNAQEGCEHMRKIAVDLGY